MSSSEIGPDARGSLGRRRPAIASRSRCSSRAASARPAAGRVPALPAPRTRRHVRLRPRRPRARAVGRLRASTSTSRPTRCCVPCPIASTPSPRRCSTRSARASAGRCTVPGTSAGDVVAVLGPGVRGLSACAAAKHAGAGFVMVTGRGARDAPRLAVARAVRRRSRDRRRRRSIPCTRCATRPAGSPTSSSTSPPRPRPRSGQAVRLARRGGTVVVAGTRGEPRRRPGFDPDQIVYKELRVLGALGVDTAAYATALDAARVAAIPVRGAPAPRSSASTAPPRCLPTWPAKATCHRPRGDRARPDEATA